MSEGAVTSSNVTTGIAMRDKPMPPAKLQKHYEEAIDKSVANTAKKKIAEVLKESVNLPRMGDHVTVDGEEGRVVGTSGTMSDEKGVAPTPRSVSIKLKSGETVTHDPKSEHIKVVKQSPQYNYTADLHFKDAATAKRLHQGHRHHDSLSKGHELMAKHHDWEGEKDKAEEHRKLSAEHKTAAEKALEYSATHREFQNQYQLASKDKQARQEQKTRTAMSNSKQSSYQHYYKVPFAEKDKAKAAGLKWDQQEKKWFKPSEMRYHTAAGAKLPWPFSHTQDNAFGKRHDD